MINGVSSISGSRNAQINEASLSDIKSKNLESQLTSQQQRLNKISGDSKMSEQEKVKERQKIQQQIAELNRKLRMEQMKEEEKEKKVEKEQKSKITDKEEIQQKEVRKEKEKSEVQEDKKVELKEISPEEIYKMLNVNSEIRRERIMENVERKKNGMENVLESEIKMDALHGIENTVKKEQLSEMRREKPIQIKVLGTEEETALGINHNGKVVIKDN